jgi:hypothetical protein
MTDEELSQNLKEGGHLVGNPVVRETDGMMLYRVDDVFMYRRDAVDLATGAATVDEIEKRNEGKIFPGASQK